MMYDHTLNDLLNNLLQVADCQLSYFIDVDVEAVNVCFLGHNLLLMNILYFIHRLYKYIREVLGKVSAIKNLEYNGSAKEKNVQDD